MGSIFSPPLPLTPPHIIATLQPATLGAHNGVPACFPCNRSFRLSVAATLAPLKPQQGIRYAHKSFKKGATAAVFVLACGSLGLIGLSRFLQCSVSFFAPNPFSAVFAVFAPVVPSATHTAKSYLTQASAVILSLHFAALHFVLSFPPLLSPQKNYTSRQKITPLPLR